MRMTAFLTSLIALGLGVTATAGTREPESTRRWREDAAYLRERMPLLHKDLFHDMTRDQYETLFARLDEAIPRLADHEIVVELARIVATVGDRDGHTHLNLFTPAAGFHRLPISFYVYADGVHVRSVARAHASIAGARVISIGGTPIERALKLVGDITPGDNSFDRKSRSINLLVLPEVLRAVGIARGEPSSPVELELVRPDGARARATLVPVKAADTVDWAHASDGAPVPLYRRFAASDPFDRHRPQKRYWYEYFPDNKVLYVNYSAVVNSPEESVAAFFARVFEFADTHDVEKFVIDIRNNGGGNNYLNRPIFYGLMKRADTICRRGRLFAIIGRETYSAAQNLANLLDIHTNAILVGEPTGGSPNHFGDPVAIELPNSGLVVRVSTLWWQDADPRDRRLWVSPHIAAELTAADERHGRDPALEAVLAWKPAPGLDERLRDAAARGAEALAAEYSSWRSEPRHKYLTGETELNALAVAMVREKKPELALALFELNARQNPHSLLAQSSLARMYASLERTADAVAHYEKALVIAPRSPAVIQALERLRAKR